MKNRTKKPKSMVSNTRPTTVEDLKNMFSEKEIEEGRKELTEKILKLKGHNEPPRS